LKNSNSKIVNSLKKVRVDDDLTDKIVKHVQSKLGKMNLPVSTRLIKAVVIENWKRKILKWQKMEKPKTEGKKRWGI